MTFMPDGQSEEGFPPISPSPDLATSDTQQRRAKRQSRALGAILIALLLCILFRTFFVDRSPESRDVSDLVSRGIDALRDTKFAYVLRDLHNRSARRAKGPIPPETSGQRQAEDMAIQDWRRLAAAATGRPADWRRLGIVLFLFDRPGGLDAFRHIAGSRPSPAPHQATAAPNRGKPGSAARRIAIPTPLSSPLQGSLPDIHARAARVVGLVTPDTELAPAKEMALWQTIYGKTPIKASEAPALRAMLAQLKLGWFDHVAAAQLYLRAGLSAQAEAASADALSSAAIVLLLSEGQWLLFLAGIVALFVCGIVILSLRSQPTSSAVTIGPGQPDLEGVAMPRPQNGVAEASGEPVSDRRPIAADLPKLSYRARLLAFIAYLAAPVALGLVFAAPILTALARRLSDTAAMRLSVVLNLALYVPMFVIVLVVLRRVAADDAPDGKRPSTRSTLAALGWRTQRPIVEVGVGILGYVMVIPPYLIAAVISAWLFQHFQTPEHPVEMLLMMAQHPADKLLLLLETAVAAPIVEETMFRGLLYPALRERWGVARAAAASAAIFALAHPTLPGGFLPLWTLGLALALAYETRGSLLPGMVMHGINNALVLCLSFAIFAQ